MPRYLPRTDFAKDVRAEVDAYFDDQGLDRRGVPRMYVKTVAVLLWLVGSYVGLFIAPSWWIGAPLAFSLGLAMAGVGFNIQHDGGHGSYSSRGWINAIMARSLDLLGGNAYFWHYKHNIAHHTHTNIAGHDEDINLGGLGRLSPHDPWHPAYRFQHLYVWGLYALLAIEWQTTGEFRNLLSKTHSGSTRIPPLGRREKLIFWLGRVVFYGLAVGLPLWLCSAWAVLAAYLVTTVTLGITLAVVFQLAHCVEPADFAAPDEALGAVPREWATHQVETTVDFARGSRILTWYLGGLNFQIEHHLFPRICHIHYRALAPIVEDVCHRHGVRYSAHATMAQALGSHWRWLRRMGADPASAAV